MALTKEQQDIVTAIQAANKHDELKIVDDLLMDFRQRNISPSSVIYIDLSIDRSVVPYHYTGAGTFIIAADASDDMASVSLGFAGTESDPNKRLTMKKGFRIFSPYTEFFLYHAAQSGKYLKLLIGREHPSIKVGIEDDSSASANSDISVALGNSSTFVTSQVTVDTTAGGTVIAAASATRRRITIQNNDAGTGVYIRTTAPTTLNGFYIPPLGSVTLNTLAGIKGITAAGSVIVSVMEE